MEDTITTVRPIISASELLEHWQGHRKLTRRVIEIFPEKELFTYSIGGMRTFSALTIELLAIAAPGLKEIVTGINIPFDENSAKYTTKEQLLVQWDESTEEINKYWEALTPENFHETNNLFGQYNFPVIQNILYFIDNEIHHRGQGFVYLRAVGIEPPFFWKR